MPFISNAFLVGDQRKYLTILLTLKCTVNEQGTPTPELSIDTLECLKRHNINNLKTISDAKASNELK